MSRTNTTLPVAQPLAAYLGISGAFVSLTATALFALRNRLPLKRQTGTDCTNAVRVCAGAYRDARRRDVAAPGAGGQVREASRGGRSRGPRARGRGWRRALGELVSCPYCATPWIAAGVVFGSLAAPKVASAMTRIFSIVAVADFLQQGYGALRKQS